MQTRKPTKKQKLLAKATKELDGYIELKVIDYEMCLYKLRADGKFDVEVSGTRGNGKYCKVYLWQKNEVIRILQMVDKVPKDAESIVTVINELLNNADDILASQQ